LYRIIYQLFYCNKKIIYKKIKIFLNKEGKGLMGIGAVISAQVVNT